MVNVSGTTNSNETNIEIIPTPFLVAAISNQSHTVLEYNVSFELNARDFSYDLDFAPSNKTGMYFTWTCMQAQEPMTSSMSECLGDTKPVNVSDFKGCFQPCWIAAPGGQIQLSTSIFLPNRTYTLQVKVAKDSRVGRAKQTVDVLPASAPEFDIM